MDRLQIIVVTKKYIVSLKHTMSVHSRSTAVDFGGILLLAIEFIDLLDSYGKQSVTDFKVTKQLTLTWVKELFYSNVHVDVL